MKEKKKNKPFGLIKPRQDTERLRIPLMDMIHSAIKSASVYRGE